MGNMDKQFRYFKICKCKNGCRVCYGTLWPATNPNVRAYTPQRSSNGK